MICRYINRVALDLIFKSEFSGRKTFKRLFSDSITGSSSALRVINEFEEPVQNNKKETKIVKVAIIGVPNAGKSSLINQLTGRWLCPVSKKVHTTRCQARAVSVEENTQIVFLDTPGLVSSNEVQRFNLEGSFLQDSELSLMEADLLGVIHDVSNRWTSGRLDGKVLRLLALYPDKSSFLVLNKVDLVKNKRELLDLVSVLTCHSLQTGRKKPKKTEVLSEAKVKDVMKEKAGWENFSEVFIVSALKGSGVDKIKEYLLRSAIPGKWLYEPSYISDITPQKLIAQTVKAKLLENFPQEVPYNLKTEVEYLDDSNTDLITAVVGVRCQTPRIQKLVIGKRGAKVKIIARAAELDLRNAFHRSVHIKIAVTSVQK